MRFHGGVCGPTTACCPCRSHRADGTDRPPGTTGQLPTPWSTFLHVGTTPRSKRCMRLRDNITSPTAAVLCRSHRADGTDRPPGHHRLTSYFFLHLASPTAEVTLSEGNRA